MLPQVSNQHVEMVRAYEALGKVKGQPPVDVLVFSRADLDQWGNVVGHILNEALVEGRIVYDSG